MGIFSRRIESAYAATRAQVISPWSEQTGLQQWVIDDALRGVLEESQIATVEIALRIPAVKRAYGLNVTEFASLWASFQQMENDTPTADQPQWLTSSGSGLSPYYRLTGIGNDFFWWGIACVGFTADMSDCMHIPFGLWENQNGTVIFDPTIPSQYHARPALIPLGHGQNGFMIDGIDAVKEAMDIAAAYRDRLKNPVPLTVLDIPWDIWQQWTPVERANFRTEWISNRRGKDGSVAMKPDNFGVNMPAVGAADLYESGRNANRLDIANLTSVPASLLEGVRQGGSGGGTDIRYTGVQNGSAANELWRFGEPRRYLLAYEGRMSMDDICPPGFSIRADLTTVLSIPEPTMNPASED